MTDHSSRPLPAGKLPATLLNDLISELPTDDPKLLLGPAVGEDAAIIDFSHESDRVLVVKSDPVTFATDEIGYYAVNICVNDLAVTGAIPRYYMPTLLLPAGQATAQLARTILRQIGAACRDLGIVVAGGHSEITVAVNQPVVAGTLLGDAPRHGYVTSGGGSPGDVVIMAGVAPVEGTSIIAREKRDVLLASGWSDHELAMAANYLFDPGISVYHPARLAAESGTVSAMHDPTEGGIATGLAELAAAAGTGIEVDFGAIPVPDISSRLCTEFDLDPYGVIASGALLAVVPPGQANEILSLWRRNGWRASTLGRLTVEPDLIAIRDGHRQPLPIFVADEITKLWN